MNSGMAIKVPVKAATTAAITLSGEQTIDGVSCVDGDRVLVKNQSSGADNGIYTVDTGTWSRAKDWDGPFDVREGTFVYVNDGTVNAGLFYVVTTADPITIGTTSVALAVVTPSSAITIPLPIAQGGTASSTKANAAAALGVIVLTGEAGTANAQTATAPSGYTAFASEDVFVFTPSVTNTGATNLTITPSGGSALAAKNVFANGAALVGGELVASVPMVLQYDGTQFNVIGLTIGNYRSTQVFTASGTWTKPSGLKRVRVTVIGGGGSGGGSAATTVAQSSSGGGGASGGASIKTIGAASLGATETVTVGAGGAQQAAGAAGVAGGTSSFGSHCQATAGNGGGAGTAIAIDSFNGLGANTPGAGSSGDINLTGSEGDAGISFGTNPQPGRGGQGGAAPLTGVVTVSGLGAAGRTGKAYGSGGSGGGTAANSAATAGGAGAGGIVIVEEFF